MRTTTWAYAGRGGRGPRIYRLGALFLVFLWLLPSCVTSDAVSKFAGESSQALGQGRSLFEDLKASCMRQQRAGLEIPRDKNGVFDLPAYKKAAAVKECRDFAAQQPGLLAALQVLTDYFAALSQLAATGTARAGKEAAANPQAAGTSGLAGDAVKALSKLSTFLGQFAAAGYREKHLTQDVKARDQDIQIVTDALVEVVKEKYERQLKREQEALRDQGLSVLEASNTPALRALLRDRWLEKVDGLESRKEKAEAFAQALHMVRDGHKKLAEAPNLRAKDVAATLKQYTDELSALLPALQKAL